MFIPTLLAQSQQRFFQVEQVLSVLSARALAVQDLFRQLIWILWT